MALTFPSSPTNGQVFYTNNFTYVFEKSSWTVVPEDPYSHSDVGIITPYNGSIPPAGWLECRGGSIVGAPILNSFNSSTNAQGYTVYASSILGVDWDGWKAFNGVIASEGWHTASSLPNGWLKVIASDVSPAKKISLINLYARTTNPERVPSDWDIRGSNDAINWDIIQTFSGHPYTQTEFVVTNDNHYKHWMLVFRDTFNGEVLNISEIVLRGEPSSRLSSLLGGTLPDYRGEFLRGWDNGRGVDSGRAINSSQNWAANYGTGGTTNSTGSHTHGTYCYWNGGGAVGGAGDEAYNATSVFTSSDGSHTHTLSVSGNTTEIRPLNVAMMYIIKE